MPVLVGAQPTQPAGLFSRRYFTAGDITMATGAGCVNSDGLRWVLESVVGWDNPPAAVADSTQRAGMDGLWLNPVFKGGRSITVVGSIGADWTTANAAVRRLLGNIGDSSLSTVIIGGAGPAMQAQVRLDQEPIVTGTQAQTRFSLSLLAPDPRRYGTDLLVASTGLPQTSGGMPLPLVLPLSVGATVSSGLLTLTNAGDKPTPPVYRVVGPCPPFSITQTGTGRRMTYNETVPVGRFVEIDVANQSSVLAVGDATTPASGASPRTVTGSWFELTPGDNSVAFTSATYNSSALLRVTYRNAWR